MESSSPTRRRVARHTGGVAPELLARVRSIQLKTSRLVNTALAGGYRSTFRGQGIEFEEVRPYQPGDEVRAIDWNVTARTGEAFVKSYREERELVIHLLVDTSLTMDFGTGRWSKREAAAQVAGLFAHVAIRSQDRVGLTLFGATPSFHLRPRKSAGHILRLIREVLAAPVSAERTDLQAVLEATGRVSKRRAMIVLLSDFVGAEEGGPWTEELLRLGRRHDVIAARLSDPLEERLEQRDGRPLTGLLPIASLDGSAQREIDASSRAVRSAWIEDAERRRAALRRSLSAAQVDYVELDASGDLADPLAAFFRRRAMARGGRRR